MTEEERSAFERSAPTTLPQQRTLHLSWNDELCTAAGEGDIPRMARALEKGANPRSKDAAGATVAHRYAYGISTSSEPDLRRHFTADHTEQAWAWLKARGVPLHGVAPLSVYEPPSPTSSVWHTIYTRGAALAHPHDGKCAEVNLWALWGNLSSQERSSILAHLDTLFLEKEKAPTRAPTKPLKGLPSFTSTLMHTVMGCEGVTRSACGQPLSTHTLQDRVLALYSLLGAPQSFPLKGKLDKTGGYAKSHTLGLWAYAPASVLHDLTSLPSYRPTLTHCLTHLVSAFHEAAAHPLPPTFPSLPPASVLVARRLARGVRTLLQNGFEFSKEEVKALLTLDEVRPLLESIVLKEALEKDTQEECSPSAPSLKRRLRL